MILERYLLKSLNKPWFTALADFALKGKHFPVFAPMLKTLKLFRQAKSRRSKTSNSVAFVLTV